MLQHVQQVQRQPHQCSSIGSVAAAAQPAQQPQGSGCRYAEEQEDLTPSQASLNMFLEWLVANGVQGIGLEDSPVGLYEEGEGDCVERGIIALQDIHKGQVLLRVPLKLAITDHADDAESNALMYEGAPWSVRLAAKLVRERAKGPASAWYPYLCVLPKKVPAPLETFSWEDMQHIEWAPMQAAIYDANWLISDSYQRAAGYKQQDAAQLQLMMQSEAHSPIPVTELSQAVPSMLSSSSSSSSGDGGDGASAAGDAAGGGADPAQVQAVLGGATEEHFQWAMSIVHSRTFANAAPGGGVGVRMLVGLVDMLNHAGDVAGTMDAASSQAHDNVRWDVVAPANSSSGWEMVVKATADICAGAPLQLSYGERSSDDFFLHYGFVPTACNPLEDAVLFEDAEEALEWHHDHYAAHLSRDKAEEVYTQAYNTMLGEQRAAASALGARSGTAGGGAVSSRDEPAAAAQPSTSSQSTDGEDTKLPKGWHKLKAYAGGRVDAALVSGFAVVTDGDMRVAELHVAQRAQAQLASMPSPLLLDLLLLYQDARMRGGSEEAQRTGHLLQHTARQTQQLQAALELHAAAVSEPVTVGDDAAVVAAQRLLAAKATHMPLMPMTGGSSLEELVAWLEREVEGRPAKQQPALKAPLTSNQLLAVRYRVAKKLVLWGVLHKAVCAQAAQDPSAQMLAGIPTRSTRAPAVPKL